MKIKKWIFRLGVAVLLLNAAVAICGASEKMSPDSIKFQAIGWETDAKGANVFIGTLRNISGKDIEFIGLRCGFFDTKGVELDHGVVTIRDIAKDGVDAFKFYPSAPAGTVTATITEVDIYAK
jgi:hypothetical protein